MAKEINVPAINTSKNNSAVKLAKACAASDARLKKYRAHNLDLLREFCGPNYANLGPTLAAKRQPLNTFYAIVSVLLPNLVGPRISTKIKTTKPELKAFSSLFQLAADHTVDQIDYAGTLINTVLASMFGMGIVKTVLDVKPLNGAPDFPNWLQDAGFPYVGQVSIDDYILDPFALAREAANFEGNKYRINEDAAHEGGFDKDVLDNMAPAYHTETHRDKEAGLSSEDGDPEPYINSYEFIDIWLPGEDTIVTIAGGKAEESKYLKEVEYKGPEGGPYDVLGFIYPPNNALPVPPVSMFYDLHLLLNTLARKLARQAERAKTILTYQKGREDDGKAMRDAADGDVLGLSDTQSLKEATTGNADPKLFDALARFKDLQNWISGNPDSVGGLAAGEKTLGQDEMKLSQAQARLGFMQALVQKFNKRVLRKVCWYLWTDPQTRLDLIHPLGKGIEIARTWSPEVREGEFPDYDIDVSPYVVGSENPLEQYRRTMQLVNSVVIPLAPMIQAQGVEIDMVELMKSLSSPLDIDTSPWFKQGMPMVGPTTGQSPGAGRDTQQAGQPSRGPQPAASTPATQPPAAIGA